MFQIERAEAVKEDKFSINVNGYEMKCSASTYLCDVWVPTYCMM